jgi:hypothetical protein
MPEEKENRSLRPFRITLIAVLAFMGAISSAFSVFSPTYPIIPFANGMFFFGNYARIYVAVFALINLYIAIGFFRLQKAAWFIYVVFSTISIAIGLFIVFTVSDAILFDTMFQVKKSQPAQIPVFFYKFFGLMAMLIYVFFLIHVVNKRNLFFKNKK